VDKSSLWAPRQNDPYKNTQNINTQNITKHEVWYTKTQQTLRNNYFLCCSAYWKHQDIHMNVIGDTLGMFLSFENDQDCVKYLINNFMNMNYMKGNVELNTPCANTSTKHDIGHHSPCL